MPIVMLIASFTAIFGSTFALSEAEKRRKQAIAHEKMSKQLLIQAEWLRVEAMNDLRRSQRALEKTVELARELGMSEESLRGFISSDDVTNGHAQLQGVH